MVEIDWNQPDPTIILSIKDIQNQTRLQHRIPVSRLSFKENNLIRKTTPGDFAGTWQTVFGPMTLTRSKDDRWTGTCADRTLTLLQDQSGLTGTWRGTNTNGKVIFQLSRDGKFLHGAYSDGELPLQLDWAGWKADWEKHFKRDDYHLRRKKK